MFQFFVFHKVKTLTNILPVRAKACVVIVLNLPALTLPAVWNTTTLLFVFASFLYLVSFYHIAMVSSFPPFFCPFNLSWVCISHSFLLSVLPATDVSSALFCTLVAYVLHIGPTTLYFIVLCIHSWLSFILEYYNTILTPYIHHSPQMKNLILPFQYFPFYFLTPKIIVMAFFFLLQGQKQEDLERLFVSSSNVPSVSGEEENGKWIIQGGKMKLIAQKQFLGSWQAMFLYMLASRSNCKPFGP